MPIKVTVAVKIIHYTVLIKYANMSIKTISFRYVLALNLKLKLVKRR